MMLEPACRGGRLISPKPACGPELSSRRSLQIFDSFMAHFFSAPDSSMKQPTSVVASIRSGEVRSA